MRWLLGYRLHKRHLRFGGSAPTSAAADSAFRNVRAVVVAMGQPLLSDSQTVELENRVTADGGDMCPRASLIAYGRVDSAVRAVHTRWMIANHKEWTGFLAGAYEMRDTDEASGESRLGRVSKARSC